MGTARGNTQLANVLRNEVDGDGRVLDAVHVEGDLRVVLLRALLAAEDLHQVYEDQPILQLSLEVTLEFDVSDTELGVNPGLESLCRRRVRQNPKEEKERTRTKRKKKNEARKRRKERRRYLLVKPFDLGLLLLSVLGSDGLVAAETHGEVVVCVLERKKATKERS